MPSELFLGFQSGSGVSFIEIFENDKNLWVKGQNGFVAIHVKENKTSL